MELLMKISEVITHQDVAEGHGRYYCTTDKKWKTRQSPKQTRKTIESQIDEKWSQKYKKSINCDHPKGFSQKAHCASKTNEAEGDATGLPHVTKKLLQHIVDQIGTEGAQAIVKSIEYGDGAAKELVQLIKQDLENHIELEESVKQRLDKSCWSGYKKQGTKMKGDVRVNNCVPEGIGEASYTIHKTNSLSVNRGDKVFHGMLGPVTVTGIKGNAVFVMAQTDNRIYKVSFSSLRSQTNEESTESKIASLEKKYNDLKDSMGMAREKRKAKGQHVQSPREMQLSTKMSLVYDLLSRAKQS